MRPSCDRTSKHPSTYLYRNIDSVGDTMAFVTGENRDLAAAKLFAARFDHTDQSLPHYGGDNWVKIALSEPARWLTAFRSTGPKAEVGSRSSGTSSDAIDSSGRPTDGR